MKTIFKSAICIIAVLCSDMLNASEVGSLQLRLVDENPSSNEPQIKMKGAQTKVRIKSEVVVDEKDILSVESKEIMEFSPKDLKLKPSDTHHIILKLKTPGAKHLKEVTSANIGKKMALLINNEIICLLIIHSEVSDTIGFSGDSLTENEKKDLIELIKKMIKENEKS